MKGFETNQTAKPIAKPRTTIEVLSGANSLSKSPPYNHNTTTNTSKSPVSRSNIQRPQSLDLRPINGARKLRDNELSYFGLNVTTSTQSHHDPSTIINNGINERRHQILLHGNRENSKTVRPVAEGKLISDKPDLLLNHSPPMQRIKTHNSLKEETMRSHRAVSVDSDGSGGTVPIYENIQPTMNRRQQQKNDRAAERQRDEENLRQLKDGANHINKVGLGY